MGGQELAWHLNRRRPGLPILFMSGYDDALLGDEDEGGAEFLAKPFTPTSLAERVAESLQATA
jgi:FixJ family two-component response regulator